MASDSTPTIFPLSAITRWIQQLLTEATLKRIEERFVAREVALQISDGTTAFLTCL